MLIKPMIGSWEVPRIESIVTQESRRLAVLPVPGLSGDLHHDMGRQAMCVQISGALYGDEARDGFLKTLREQFLLGDPVDFVADIVGESELEQVLIEGFELAEDAALADTFHFSLRLREYTEPPEPAATAGDFAPEVDADLGLDVDLGLDLLDLPGLLGAVPALGDMLSPVKAAAGELKTALGGAGTLLQPLSDLLG